MNAWNITIIATMAAGLGMSLVKHGEDRTGKWSFPIALISALINGYILFRGGLWN